MDEENEQAVKAFREIIKFFNQHRKELKVKSFTDGLSEQFEFENLTFVKSFNKLKTFQSGSLYLDDKEIAVLHQNGETSLDLGFQDDIEDFMNAYNSVKPNMDYFDEHRKNLKKLHDRKRKALK